MKIKAFAKIIKKKLEKINRGNFKNQTIKIDGIEAEINDGMIFFAMEYVGIYVRFSTGNTYLFTAKFKLHDSVEQIEEIASQNGLRLRDRKSDEAVWNILVFDKIQFQ